MEHQESQDYPVQMALRDLKVASYHLAVKNKFDLKFISGQSGDRGAPGTQGPKGSTGDIGPPGVQGKC